VITDSENTRREVLAWLGLSAQRVVAVPIAADPRFAPATAAVEEFRRQRGLPARFALFLGTLEPRKNLVRLVDAYATCQARLNVALPLVIAGSRGWYYDEIFARVQAHGLQDSILFPGFVPAGELPWWYRAADVFVYPSVYEGFGLPVLEAMASGTAVITSNTSSLPEVAGDAALLVDPNDVEALASAMAQVLNDHDLRQAMSAAGVRQAAKFSWRRCAEETVAVYRAVLGLAAPPAEEPP
jgi:glycosyltransferase involved in cell wall biosynthesis